MNEPPSSRVGTLTASRSALVLYGSETGNAHDVAEEIGRLFDRLHFEATVLDLDSAELRNIIKYTAVVFVVSTTGQGEFPQNARRFWRALLSSALRPGVLRKLRFTSFGLGDSSYALFNVAHRMLHGRLTQLGAQAFCERGEGNEQHPEGHSAGVREWIVELRQSLTETFPLPSGVLPVADDVFIEPKWKLGLAPSQDQTEGTRRGIYVEPSHKDSGQTMPMSVPPPDLLPVLDTYAADIKSNDRLTPTTHFQDVRLLDLRIPGHVEYGPGAVAVIRPKNFPDDVQSFIDLMGWNDIVDLQLQVDSNKSRSGSSPSPLRHLDLSGTNLTMRWLLENAFDIMSIPRRSFFASLSYFAGNESEDETYQKERLLELANPELIDELWDYTTRPKRTIIEVMMDFTTIKIPWRYAFSVLPIIRGRQFSIASGGALRLDEGGNTRIQLLIAIVDPPSPIIKWRRRYGVCTRYVAALQPGQQISIGVQQGYLDVRPSELEAPVVMVGPGTGLAPMRSMVNQRLLWAQEDSHKRNHRLHGDILFFGCRNEAADYFFHSEWLRLAETDGLAVFTAFSRDSDKPREYVQDHIRAQGAVVRDALLKSNGKVYVCGSSGNMPKGVRRAFLEVFANDGKTMSLEEAEAYLESMEKNGRYKQETW